MARSTHTISDPAMLPVYPRLIYLALLEEGFNNDQILGGLDITAEQLHDEKYRLSLEQHERFILHVLALTANPHFAIQVARSYDPASANITLLAVANCGKISKALHLFTRYHRLVSRAFSIRSFEINDLAVMDIESHLEHDSVTYFALCSLVLMLDNFFREVLNGAHLVERVEMSILKPGGFDEVAEDFGIPVTFGAPRTLIYFDKSLLDKSVRQADPQTVRLLMEMSERQLDEADAETSFVGAVNAILIKHIASPPKLDDAATMLGVSPRGLRRKLEQSGTSYQKLLDLVRSKMAIRLLQETDEPVSSIAYELGFDNPSDFGRAFKKWTGKPPSSIRSGKK
ncbi:ornithine utilization transcriptional regulator OruR [Maricurvus nonylphenolicus]|uniref:AraC family transcriptional regulator n=1 Tax=Maricurvus nonylphenolicus TaxID=1008307 RepID=UPI0036F3EB99